MNPQNALDDHLTRALESVPHVAIPDDFASRVLARLPARPAPRRQLPEALPARPSIGRRVSLAALILLFLAMLAVSLRAGTPHLIEYACAAEFILLSLWLSLRPQSRLR